jgi:hypothetical protein
VWVVVAAMVLTITSWLVIPEGVGPVNPVNPCSCSVIFSLGVLRLFLGAPG